MVKIDEKLKALGLTLPNPPPKGGVYTPVQEFGSNFLYCSGCGCDLGGGNTFTGKLGRELTLEEGRLAARNCMLNLLANLQQKLSDLGKIKRFVKVLAFVAGSDGFYQQPQVVNGASELLVELFGQETGCPARSAIGVNALPGNIPVEIELLVEVE